MIKTIFVPASGSRTDASVFATALAIAHPLAAHLQVFHMHLSPCEAAAHAPYVEFCQGPALEDALSYLREQGDYLCASAVRHFQELCESYSVPVLQRPGLSETLSASWAEESAHPSARMLFHARHSDVVVLGRPHNQDYMPRDLIETLLLYSGRPIVIAPDTQPRSVTGTVVVAWKETAEAARALAASLPLLRQARQVVLLTVTEDGAASPEALRHLTRQLEWHQIYAEASVIDRDSLPVAAHLAETAAQLNADLLVMGGYGHGPLRESVFGGVTRAVIEKAGLPVLLMH
jgi:nucleotide-binding universal stress UspA family protein